MYAVRLWSVRHARRTRDASIALFERAWSRCHPLWKRIGYQRLEKPVAAVEKAVKGLLFDCRMCGHCVLCSTGMSCPMNCPKTCATALAAACAPTAIARSKPRDGLRLGRGLAGQPSGCARQCERSTPCSRRSTAASRARRPGCASRARTSRSREMSFEDEPVPGYPLPILPGHTSPGRLERVLRAGAFAVTAELDPPDSADPEDVYQAGARLRRLRRRDQRHRRQRRQLPHVERRRLRPADPRRLRAGDADLLPRPQPHRDPGRHPRRRGDGRLQHAVPHRRRRAGGRPSAGQARVRPRLHDAARHRRATCATSTTSSAAARSPTRRGCSSAPPRIPFAPPVRVPAVAASRRRSPPARSSSRRSTATTCRCLRAFMRQVEDLGLLDRVFILVGVGPLRSAKAAEWMRTHVPGVHIPDAIVEAHGGRRRTRRAKDASSASSSSRRSARSRAWPACM